MDSKGYFLTLGSRGKKFGRGIRIQCCPGGVVPALGLPGSQASEGHKRKLKTSLKSNDISSLTVPTPQRGAYHLHSLEELWEVLEAPVGVWTLLGKNQGQSSQSWRSASEAHVTRPVAPLKGPWLKHCQQWGQAKEHRPAGQQEAGVDLAVGEVGAVPAAGKRSLPGVPGAWLKVLAKRGCTGDRNEVLGECQMLMPGRHCRFGEGLAAGSLGQKLRDQVSVSDAKGL